MIKEFQIHGLNGNTIPLCLNFNKDINILTGKNGSGKTTVLKVLWYILSGNIENVINEVVFDHILLSTDKFTIKIEKHDGEEINYLIILNDDKPVKISGLSYKQYIERRIIPQKARVDLEKINAIDASISGLHSTIYFPTFRRIEGGYTYSESGRFSDSFEYYRERLSTANHHFITAISTKDIVELLTEQYANRSEKANNLHVSLSKIIEEKISEYSKSKSLNIVQNVRFAKAEKVLEEIKQKISAINENRDEIFKPYSILTNLIEQIFEHKGIRVTENITLGDAKEAMFSETLSAGEKQMLSFICYNAFYENSIVFIDEPELSLHVDWQRILFPTLLSQSTNNQFVVATHSPFIYSRYSDKELLLGSDRGDNE